MRVRYFWFVVAVITASGIILIPVLQLGRNWMLDLLAGTIVIFTGVLWYAAHNRKRFGLRLKLIVAGNLIVAFGVLSWGSIGQNLVYAGLAFWLVAYVLLWVVPNKGVPVRHTEDHSGTTAC
jgi:hypothetical protein